MDRRAIALALSSLLGLILAVMGAVLLAYVGATLYDLAFPGARISASTEGTISEFVTYAQHWSTMPGGSLSTTIPFAPSGQEGIAFFGKDTQKISFMGRENQGPSISPIGLGEQEGPKMVKFAPDLQRPPIAECKDVACVCLYDTSDKCGAAELATSPLLKCWALKGVDEIPRQYMLFSNCVGFIRDTTLTLTKKDGKRVLDFSYPVTR